MGARSGPNTFYLAGCLADWEREEGRLASLSAFSALSPAASTSSIFTTAYVTNHVRRVLGGHGTVFRRAAFCTKHAKSDDSSREHLVLEMPMQQHQGLRVVQQIVAHWHNIGSGRAGGGRSGREESKVTQQSRSVGNVEQSWASCPKRHRLIGPTRPTKYVVVALCYVGTTSRNYILHRYILDAALATYYH